MASDDDRDNRRGEYQHGGQQHQANVSGSSQYGQRGQYDQPQQYNDPQGMHGGNYQSGAGGNYGASGGNYGGNYGGRDYRGTGNFADPGSYRGAYQGTQSQRGRDYGARPAYRGDGSHVTPGNYQGAGYQGSGYEGGRGMDEGRGQGGYAGGDPGDYRPYDFGTGDYGGGNFGTGNYGGNGEYGGGYGTGGYYGAGRWGGSDYDERHRAGQRGGQGFDDSRNQTHYDPDYLQWRQQQMRELDNDYNTWRQDRYKKFSDEFSSWRDNRRNAARSDHNETGSERNAQQASSGKDNKAK